MRTGIARWIALPLTFLIFLVGCSQEPVARSERTVEKARERALVGFTSGKAEVYSSDLGWFPLEPGADVSVGDSVRTGSDGRLELQSDGRTLRLESGTTGVLVGEEGEDRVDAVGIRVNEGRVWVHLDGRRDFTVEGPGVVVLARNATFSVADAGGTALVATYEGEAEVRGPRGRARLRAGNGLRMASQGYVHTQVAGNDDWRDGWLSRVRGVPSPRPRREEARRSLERQELRDLNPHVYSGVELEVGGSRIADSLEVDTARIRRIRVRAGAWDALRPDRRVDLLNETFAVLKARYPEIQNGVVLNFDDQRPDLALRYPGDL